MSRNESVKRSNSRLHRTTIGDVIIVVLLTLLAFSMFYPFLNLVFQSLSTNAAITKAEGMMLWPSEVTFDNYLYVFHYSNVWLSYKNTIFITVVGTSLSLVLTTMGGYALSKKDLPFRLPMTIYVLITMFIGGGLIPTYLNLRNLGFLNTLWVMIIPDTISVSNLLLMRNFFMAQPEELKESAYIDGASEFRTLISIVLPLSSAILATMTLFYGVSNWNEYTAAILYNHESKYYPIQVILNRMYKNSMQMVMDEDYLLAKPPASDAVRAATVIFATFPIMCSYPFLQKYFAKGIMVGSLKG